MNKKRILATVMAMGMLVQTTGVTALAASGSETTPVTYDNTSTVPDPDNPDSPQWAVTIPSAIAFSDDNKTIDASVELIAKNGATTLPNVNVTVSSQKGYKLENATGDEVSYALKYGNKTMTNADTAVATLTQGAAKSIGTATLGADASSSKRGTYEDTLTYSVEKATP